MTSTKLSPQLRADLPLASRATFWTVQIVAWSALGINNYLQAAPDLQEFERLPLFLIKMAFSALGVCFSSLLYAAYAFLIRWFRDPVSLLLSAALACCCLGFTWHLFYRLALPPPFGGMDHILQITFIFEAVNNIFVLCAWSAVYYGLWFWRNSKLQEQAVVEANALTQEAKLKALQYQLNPHFLFNSLNSVRALTRDDSKRAGEMVTQLSEFLRSTLTETPLEEFTIEQEVAVLKKYLAVEKTRFEEKLHTEIEIAPEVANCVIPGLLIHPLLENAIKHSMRTSATPLRISLRASRLEGKLRIEVSNTGSLIQTDNTGNGKDTGIGVSNVRERLEHSYPGQYEFDLYQDGDWVRAVICIMPKQGEKDASGN